ncbi:hypothetical protein [Prevotella heparinolytica]|uniref:hypothetical protein n=1 Tax=Prevotella heparinolytica TaxID=28113 RepID=UPI00163A9B37|nr:hypothetical protein [Bacteroides heparinolyticus]
MAPLISLEKDGNLVSAIHSYHIAADAACNAQRGYYTKNPLFDVFLGDTGDWSVPLVAAGTSWMFLMPPKHTGIKKGVPLYSNLC